MAASCCRLLEGVGSPRLSAAPPTRPASPHPPHPTPVLYLPPPTNPSGPSHHLHLALTLSSALTTTSSPSQKLSLNTSSAVQERKTCSRGRAIRGGASTLKLALHTPPCRLGESHVGKLKELTTQNTLYHTGDHWIPTRAAPNYTCPPACNTRHAPPQEHQQPSGVPAHPPVSGDTRFCSAVIFSAGLMRWAAPPATVDLLQCSAWEWGRAHRFGHAGPSRGQSKDSDQAGDDGNQLLEQQPEDSQAVNEHQLPAIISWCSEVGWE